VRVGIFGYEGDSGRDAGMRTIKVHDDRLTRLAAVYRPKKVTPISITFLEIDPGETALLSADTLVKIKGVDVLVLVLRGFSDDFHPAPPGGLDPVKEFRQVESELVVSDYLVAQKRVERKTKEARRDTEWAALHPHPLGFPVRKPDTASPGAERGGGGPLRRGVSGTRGESVLAERIPDPAVGQDRGGDFPAVPR
jgi:hypothetical protein